MMKFKYTLAIEIEETRDPESIITVVPNLLCMRINWRALARGKEACAGLSICICKVFSKYCKYIEVLWYGSVLAPRIWEALK